MKIKNATEQGYLEATDGDGIDISGRMETHRGTVQKDRIQTIKCQPDVGVCVKDERNERERESSEQLRIRKLTPCECMRLMGGTDEMYKSLKEIGGLSDSQIYHCCGDGLIPQIVSAIVKEMKP